jgi:CBS domain-containing protein
MTVKELMSDEVACCTPDTSLRDVASLMVDHDCGAIPVIESATSRKLVGLITDRDIICRTLAQGKDPFHMAVGDCMSTPVVTVAPDSAVEECTRKMEQSQVRRLVVVDRSGDCIGMVAQADLARHAEACRTGDMVEKVSQETNLTAQSKA